MSDRDCYGVGFVRDLERRLEKAHSENTLLARRLAEAQGELDDLKACQVEPKIIDTVVLAGWHGMTMTQDHNGNTVFRRTS